MEKSTFSLLPIKNDYVFKRIFSYEGNEDVLYTKNKKNSFKKS